MTVFMCLYKKPQHVRRSLLAHRLGLHTEQVWCQSDNWLLPMTSETLIYTIIIHIYSMFSLLSIKKRQLHFFHPNMNKVIYHIVII